MRKLRRHHPMQLARSVVSVPVFGDVRVDVEQLHALGVRHRGWTRTLDDVEASVRKMPLRGARAVAELLVGGPEQLELFGEVEQNHLTPAVVGQMLGCG